MGFDGANDNDPQPSQDSSASSPSRRADRMSTFSTKLSIGRLSGTLNHKPNDALLIVDTTIESCAVSPTGESIWKPVESGRLRRLAANKWLG